MRSSLLFPNAPVAFVTVLLCASTTQAHTWIEQLRRIAADGTFTGDKGYQRGYLARGPGVSVDDHMVYRLTGATIDAKAPMCKETQQTGMQGNFPMLEAAPKDFIALQYLENGHVTKVLDPRPAGNGTVYVYGTKQASNSDTFMGIHKQWNAAGTGGDKKGKLLATRFFDDGQCYQDNPSAPISAARIKASGQSGEVPCQTDLQLPEDAGDSQYTLYWVWDYALMDNSGKQANNEMYTACMDVKMTGKSKTSDIKVKANAPILERAIPDHIKTAFIADPTADNALTAKPFNGGDTAKPPATSANAPAQSSASASDSKSAAPTQSSPSKDDPKASKAPSTGDVPVTVTVTTALPASTVTVTRDGSDSSNTGTASEPAFSSTSLASNQRPKPTGSASSDAPSAKPTIADGITSKAPEQSGKPSSSPDSSFITKTSEKPSSIGTAPPSPASPTAAGPPKVSPFLLKARTPRRRRSLRERV